VEFLKINNTLYYANKLEYIWVRWGTSPHKTCEVRPKVEEHEDFKGTIKELNDWSY